jgi:ATP-dependent HslUV protease ATP-binding subunit HslU
MVIYLEGDVDEQVGLDEMTPRQIVAELDKHVVGQRNAKRAVAVALRNRIRRQKLPPEMAVDVMPKNIIMIGSTGVGKTEIARRLARMSNSPFLKVEASKFTEVGYVGRDVESIIRDLTEISVDMTRQEKSDEVAEKAELNVEERILDLLLPPPRSSSSFYDFDSTGAEVNSDDVATSNDPGVRDEQVQRTREKLRTQLREGKLDNRLIEMEIREKSFPVIELAGPQGIEEMGINMKDMLGNMFQGRTRQRKMRVDEAMEYLMQEEEERLIDMDQVARAAIERVEDSGIIFLDEIDKIAGRESGHGPDVSREGVQRDILPIVEGTTVNTRYGMVRTDHVLFIAAGAFHVSKPSDLIPELQGRFPIRVELESLTIDDFKRILTEPKNALIKQYQAMMATEEVIIDFTDDAIDAIANFAARVNEQTENIGARRLQTIMEKLLEEISFEGPDLDPKQQRIDAAYVEAMLAETVKDQDLSRYIL